MDMALCMEQDKIEQLQFGDLSEGGMVDGFVLIRTTARFFEPQRGALQVGDKPFFIVTVPGGRNEGRGLEFDRKV